MSLIIYRCSLADMMPESCEIHPAHRDTLFASEVIFYMDDITRYSAEATINEDSVNYTDMFEFSPYYTFLEAYLSVSNWVRSVYSTLG
jgi:hypothetical protein